MTPQLAVVYAKVELVDTHFHYDGVRNILSLQPISANLLRLYVYTYLLDLFPAWRTYP